MVVVLLAAAEFLAVAPSASASVGCASSYGSLFDGYYGQAAEPGYPTYEGVSAVMTVEPAVVCDTGVNNPPGGKNFVYTWTMIHQNNNAPGGSGYGYAQIGFYQEQGQCAYYTTEYNGKYPDTFSRDIFTGNGCLATGQSHEFWEQYIPSTGRLSLNVDLTPFTVTPFDPYSNWNYGAYGPFYTEFFAESKYLGSNVPTTTFEYMQVQKYSDDQFTYAIPTMLAGCPWPVRYTHGAVTSNAFNIQTVGGSDVYYC